MAYIFKDFTRPGECSVGSEAVLLIPILLFVFGVDVRLSPIGHGSGRSQHGGGLNLSRIGAGGEQCLLSSGISRCLPLGHSGGRSELPYGHRKGCNSEKRETKE
jgi:hypothetical protein